MHHPSVTVKTQDLFGESEKVITKLPRLQKIEECAIDAPNSEEWHKRQIKVQENNEARRLVLQAREAAKNIRKEIVAVRKQRALIKGRSKDAQSKRESFDNQILGLKAKLKAF
jgi:hypothetical protein